MTIRAPFAPAFKAAIFALCQSTFTDCLVTYGDPGVMNGGLFDVVVIGNARSGLSPVNLGRRSMDEVTDLQVQFWASTGGDWQVQQTVTELVYSRASQLLQALNTDPQQGLNPNLWFSHVSEMDLEETDDEWMSLGRYARLTVNVHTTARLTQ